MIVIALLLIPQPMCAVWIALAIASIDIGVIGFMTLWDVKLVSFFCYPSSNHWFFLGCNIHDNSKWPCYSFRINWFLDYYVDWVFRGLFGACHLRLCHFKEGVATRSNSRDVGCAWLATYSRCSFDHSCRCCFGQHSRLHDHHFLQNRLSGYFSRTSTRVGLFAGDTFALCPKSFKLDGWTGRLIFNRFSFVHFVLIIYIGLNY